MFPIVEFFPGSLGGIWDADIQTEVDPKTVEGAGKEEAGGSYLTELVSLQAREQNKNVHGIEMGGISSFSMGSMCISGLGG